MKKALLALGGVIFACATAWYGPAVVSYAIIPPEHGYFRYYENLDMERRGEVYWNYWKCTGNMVEWGDLRQNRSGEEWELVRDAGHRYFRYDARNEFAGVLTFTRTEMVLTDPDGGERRYQRVVDLWEIWKDRMKGNSQDMIRSLLAPRRQEHLQRIAARMKERGIRVSPAMMAQRRPPVIAPASPAVSLPSQIPLLSLTEFGYRNDTGTVFTVYSDGTVICRSLPENPAAPFHRCDVPNAALFVRELLGPDYLRQSEKITLSDATDQTVTTLWTPERSVEIYGRWREPDKSWGPPDEWTTADKEFNERMNDRWDSALAGIRPALQRIDDLRKGQGPNWLPAKIEVCFSDYEHSWDEPIEWPPEWPGLYSDTSKKHDAYSYSVFVPSADFAKLNAFLDTRRERGAVMIDLNRMAPSVRFPFPGEAAWLKR